jgi:hypothetical protein
VKGKCIQGSSASIPSRDRFYSSSNPDRLSDPPSLLPIQRGTMALTSRVKRLEREANYSPTFSARIRKRGALHSVPNTWTFKHDGDFIMQCNPCCMHVALQFEGGTQRGDNKLTWWPNEGQYKYNECDVIVVSVTDHFIVGSVAWTASVGHTHQPYGEVWNLQWKLLGWFN